MDQGPRALWEARRSPSPRARAAFRPLRRGRYRLSQTRFAMSDADMDPTTTVHGPRHEEAIANAVMDNLVQYSPTTGVCVTPLFPPLGPSATQCLLWVSWTHETPKRGYRIALASSAPNLTLGVFVGRGLAHTTHGFLRIAEQRKCASFQPQPFPDASALS